MSVLSNDVMLVLAKFLAQQVEEHDIRYLVALGSKGALLLDRILATLDEGSVAPVVLYLQGVTYLPAETRRTAEFALVDDVTYSGRTAERARRKLVELGIPTSNIHLMSFFRFVRQGDQDVRDDVLARISVPTSALLLQLPQPDVLASIQSLTLDQRLAAAHDTLVWDADVSNAAYLSLMRDLARSDWFTCYGQRGASEASALLVEAESATRNSAYPKLRLWYDKENGTLRVSAVSFPEMKPDDLVDVPARLIKILTPENASEEQAEFARYLATAIQQQIHLVGFLKSHLRRLGIRPVLRQEHIARCFGPRANEVSTYVDAEYAQVPERAIPVNNLGVPRLIDFQWVAVRIMRSLGAAFWKQEPPRLFPVGYSVSELVRDLSGEASAEAVHAAVDYCVDMNLVSAFFRKGRQWPTRALRLTENGEAEVGGAHGPETRSLSFPEKLGALILDTCPDKRAYWWVLEKTPAILRQRFGCNVPQIAVAKHYYGDMSRIRLTEDSKGSMTWLHLASRAWKVTDVQESGTKNTAKLFTLDASEFARHRASILGDSRLLGLLAPLQTTLELITETATQGHQVAILLDILSDRAGGATYLADLLERALELIRTRSFEANAGERQKQTERIDRCLEGVDDKCRILLEKRDELLAQIGRTVERLKRERRGDLAELLMETQPLPIHCRIIPALRELSRVVRQLATSMDRKEAEEIAGLVKGIKVPWTREEDESPNQFDQAADLVIAWGRALSAWQGETDDYNRARLNVSSGRSGRVVIVAYDLIGSSGGKYKSRMAADRDNRIQSIITNWFIAFGGYAQRSEMGGGDLGFGFFNSEQVAVRAALWASYHLECLKLADPVLRGSNLHAGFGIVEDEYHAGFMQQVYSHALSRFAKAWKHEAERIAEYAGRVDRPPVAIHRDLVSPLSGIPKPWIGDPSEIHDIPVNFIREVALGDLPWTR